MEAAVLAEEAEVTEAVVQSRENPLARRNPLDAACREVGHQSTGPLSIDVPLALLPIDVLQFPISPIHTTKLVILEAWLQWLLQFSR